MVTFAVEVNYVDMGAMRRSLENGVIWGTCALGGVERADLKQIMFCNRWPSRTQLGVIVHTHMYLCIHRRRHDICEKNGTNLVGNGLHISTSRPSHRKQKVIVLTRSMYIIEAHLEVTC